MHHTAMSPNSQRPPTGLLCLLCLEGGAVPPPPSCWHGSPSHSHLKARLPWPCLPPFPSNLVPAHPSRSLHTCPGPYTPVLVPTHLSWSLYAHPSPCTPVLVPAHPVPTHLSLHTCHGPCTPVPVPTHLSLHTHPSPCAPVPTHLSWYLHTCSGLCTPVPVPAHPSLSLNTCPCTPIPVPTHLFRSPHARPGPHTPVPSPHARPGSGKLFAPSPQWRLTPRSGQWCECLAPTLDSGRRSGSVALTVPQLPKVLSQRLSCGVGV